MRNGRRARRKQTTLHRTTSLPVPESKPLHRLPQQTNTGRKREKQTDTQNQLGKSHMGNTQSNRLYPQQIWKDMQPQTSSPNPEKIWTPGASTENMEKAPQRNGKPRQNSHRNR